MYSLDTRYKRQPVQKQPPASGSMRRSLRSRRKRDDASADIVYVKDDQPQNPYTEIQILSQHTDIVRLLIRINPYRCASTGDDCQVIVWDIEVGRKLHVLSGHRRPVTCMCLMEATVTISTDHLGEPPILLTGASDKLICAWNVDVGSCLFTVTDHDGPIRCLLTLPEHDVFCGAGENLCLWDRDGRLLTKYNRHEDEDIQGMIVMRSDMLVTIVDKQLVVYGTSVEGAEGAERWTVRLLRKLPAHREAIRSLVQVNDGCFASGSLDGTIVLWTMPLVPSRYFNALKDYEGEDRVYPYSIQHVMVTEERYLFAAIGTGFCVYDSVSGRLLAQKQHAHYSKVLYMQFVYNGSVLASCSEDGSIRLWGPPESATGSPKEDDRTKMGRTLPAGSPTECSTIEKFMGLSKQDLKTSNTIEPRLIGECLAHSGAVQMCLDFDAEGFVSCGVDGLLVAWKDGCRQDYKRSAAVRSLLLGPTLEGIV